MSHLLPTADDVRAAAQRIAPFVRRTPALNSEDLREASGAAAVVLKCETMQAMGAFKLRGATNAVLCLDESSARRGVATHSSGNHGAALALAAQRRGIPCYVVVPENVSTVKLRNIEQYGAHVTFCAPTLEGREAMVAQVLRETGATLVHPFDDPLVMAGQGTAALELLQDAPGLDVLLVPVSGGGLISGSCLAAHAIRSDVEIVGAEPELADDAARSLRAGRLMPAGPSAGSTIADGLRATLSERTFALVRERVADVLTVSEAQIVQAVRFLLEQVKLVAEPSGAVPVAALLADPRRFRGRRVGIILSGGNLDWAQAATWFAADGDNAGAARPV